MSQPWLDPGAWAKLIDSLIWPGVVVGIIYVYRRQASALLSRVKHFQITGVLDANFTAVSSEVSKTGDLAAQGASRGSHLFFMGCIPAGLPLVRQGEAKRGRGRVCKEEQHPGCF